MPNFTEDMNLYMPDVETDNSQTDFFPNLAENFRKISIHLMTTWVIPQVFGAVGNYDMTSRSGNDDTDAFQKALNIARDKGSVNILVPPGIYQMTAELVFYKNTKIQLAPGARVIRNHAGYMGINGVRDTPNAPGGYDGQGNLHIDGGIWDGNGPLQPSQASIFHFGHAQNITIENATLQDVAQSHHIEVNACKDVKIRKNRIVGTTLQNAEEAIQLDLAYPTVYGPDVDTNGDLVAHNVTTILPADSTPCKNVTIEDNYIGPSGTPGTFAPGRGVGSHTSVIGFPHENIKILHNTFEDISSYAIRCYNYQDVTIRDNRLYDCAAGINVRTPDTSDQKDTIDSSGNYTNASQDNTGIHIIDNIIKGGLTYSYGIIVWGEATGKIYGAEIRGNKFYCDKTVSAWAGIYSKQAEETDIKDNRLEGIGATAIVVTDASHNAQVQGNILKDIKGSGILLSAVSHYVSMNGNTLKSIGDHGILVNDVNEGVTLANNIFGGVNGNAGSQTGINFIRFATGGKRIAITGNVTRNLGTTNVTGTALYIPAACTQVSRTGNIFQGFAVSDSSGSAVAGDVL